MIKCRDQSKVRRFILVHRSGQSTMMKSWGPGLKQLVTLICSRKAMKNTAPCLPLSPAPNPSTMFSRLGCHPPTSAYSRPSLPAMATTIRWKAVQSITGHHRDDRQNPGGGSRSLEPTAFEGWSCALPLVSEWSASKAYSQEAQTDHWWNFWKMGLISSSMEREALHLSLTNICHWQRQESFLEVWVEYTRKSHGGF